MKAADLKSRTIKECMQELGYSYLAGTTFHQVLGPIDHRVELRAAPRRFGERKLTIEFGMTLAAAEQFSFAQERARNHNFGYWLENDWNKASFVIHFPAALLFGDPLTGYKNLKHVPEGTSWVFDREKDWTFVLDHLTPEELCPALQERLRAKILPYVRSITTIEEFYRALSADDPLPWVYNNYTLRLSQVLWCGCKLGLELNRVKADVDHKRRWAAVRFHGRDYDTEVQKIWEAARDALGKSERTLHH